MKNNKSSKTHKSATKSNSSQKKSAPVSFHQASRNALGRGLSALIRPAMVNVNSAPSAQAASSYSINQASVDRHVYQSNAQPLPQASALPANLSPFQPEIIEGGRSELSSEQKSETMKATHQEPAIADGLVMLEISKLQPNPHQPRKIFAPDEITSLSQSIRETGLLQPILVRHSKHDTQKFEIVAGERRYRAAVEAGLSQVPVILKELGDLDALEISIIENVQRTDLNPIEEAMAYQRLFDEFHQTQAEIAEAVGKDRASIANSLRLLKLSPKLIEHINQKKLSAGHGKVLLTLESHSAQERLAERIIKDNLSVRETERQLQRYLQAKPEDKNRRSIIKEKSLSVIDLEDRIRRVLGTKIALSINQQGGGELRVLFYSREELESIIEKIGA
ncbi:MAG: ParB/RepB/Spo0J family partition protein [Deltaproteobacteria bacterium]|nr:ParB/RepB/Spo0J family partition protein [Deltaproteobacteria bacterium]